VNSALLEALGQVLPLAVGISLSPLPIIAVVLTAMSPRARASGPAFVAGRMLGLAFVAGVVIAASDLVYSLTSAAGLPAIVKLVLGLALVVLGVSKWRPKPKGVEPALPGWMSAFSSASPGRAFSLSLLLSVANPKELALLVAVGVTVGGAPLSVGDEVLVGIGVVVIASLPVVLPVLAILIAPARVRPALEGLRTWLTANSSVVMGLLLVVIGAVVTGGAIGEL